MTVSAIPTEDVATTIHYEMTQQDLEAFQWYYFHHSPTLRRQQRNTRMIVTVFAPCLALLVLPVLFRNDMNYAVSIPILIVYAILIFILYPQVVKWQYKRNVRKLLIEGPAKSFPRKCTLRLHPNSIETQSQIGRNTIHWSAIEQIATTNEHLFMFMNTASAVIVPKRAFETDEEYVAFLETAERYRQMAQPASA